MAKARPIIFGSDKKTSRQLDSGSVYVASIDWSPNLVFQGDMPLTRATRLRLSPALRNVWIYHAAPFSHGRPRCSKLGILPLCRCSQKRFRRSNCKQKVNTYRLSPHNRAAGAAVCHDKTHVPRRSSSAPPNCTHPSPACHRASRIAAIHARQCNICCA